MLSYELFCEGNLIDVGIGREVPDVGDVVTCSKGTFYVKSVGRELNKPARVVATRVNKKF